MNKELMFYIPDIEKIQNIINKYKNIATTKSIYYKSLENLVRKFEGIPPSRLELYEVYINLSYDAELIEDIKEICKEYRIKSGGKDFLPEDVIAVVVNKTTWPRWLGGVYE